MKIFLDTANIEDIKEYKQWGIASGVTTNQKIFLKEKGVDFKEQAQRILDLVDGPVSLEAPANTMKGIVEKAREFSELGDNVVIKVPMTGGGEGLKAVDKLESEGIKTNVTAMMTLNQAFLAASAGASYMSLFYNRMKDWWRDNKLTDRTIYKDTISPTEYAMSTVTETMQMLKGDYKTQLIIGSIRDPVDVEEIIRCSPSVVTIPIDILDQMPYNKKTEATLDEFDECWEEFKEA